jgi:hypothetical protein
MPSNPSLRRAQPDKLTGADREVARLAAGQWGVLSVDELRACGLSRDAILTRVRRGNLHPLHRGVYAVGHRNVVTEGRFLAAVKACGRDAVLSHYAACCHRGWLRYDGRPIDVTTLGRRRRPGIKTHETDRVERELVRQIPTTPRVRTIIDLARQGDERIVKRALRQAKFTEAELDQLPSAGPLGRIVNLSAAHTASGNEDFVLDLVLNAGFAHPEVNAPYQLPGQVYYPDLWWPEVRLIVEVDSREHHEAPLDQRDDLDRQAWLESVGERVLRTTKPQVKRDPRRFLARLSAAGAPYTSPAQTQL